MKKQRKKVYSIRFTNRLTCLYTLFYLPQIYIVYNFNSMMCVPWESFLLGGISCVYVGFYTMYIFFNVVIIIDHD